MEFTSETSSNILKDAYLQANTNFEELPIKILDDGEEFCTLVVTAQDTSKTQSNTNRLFFKFTIDNSGSMSDNTKDGRSKMQQVNHCMTNMMRSFVERTNTTFIVQIDGFDTQIYPIFEPTQITNDNLESVIKEINKQYPRNSTNIELGLKNANKIIDKYINENPNDEIIHIFMTDGDANEGISEPVELAKLINPKYQNIFIGFGKDHNSLMLETLSSNKYGSQYVIDNIENCGIVYGEIIYNVLYKALYDIRIKVINGLIYNYQKNTWDSELEIPSIASNATKTFHVKTMTRDTVEVVIYGCVAGLTEQSQILIETVTCIPDLIEIDTGIVVPINLANEMFRNYTMSLLYKARHNSNDIELKNELKSFISLLKKYMEDHNLNEDLFYKILCDDIYITYKTIGTRHAHMYSCSRQTSQGAQRSCPATMIDDDETPNNSYRQQRCTMPLSLDIQDNDNFLEPEIVHTVYRGINKLNTTPEAMCVMRELSAGINSDI